MWLGLLEDNSMFFAGTSKCVNVGVHHKLTRVKRVTFLVFVCAAINNVNNSAIGVRTATLTYSRIKACIGFALRLAEPLNGFLRALLEIPLTTQQGVDLSFFL